MAKHLTLEYWITEKWYVGKLREAPGVFSQGKTLAELEENVRDAYRLMMEDDADLLPHGDTHIKELEIAV